MIEGLDISHWNGTNIDWQKMKDAGIQFLYIKCSQGIDYKDSRFEKNIENAHEVGMKVGAYHFVTNEDALGQYKWFVSCMGEHKFELPPALDCEAYNYSADSEFKAVIGFRQANYEAHKAQPYIITTEEIVRIICKNLEGYKNFHLPAIYTNKFSGDQIFHTPEMSVYPLWIANWDVNKPALPNVWKDEPYYIWQNGVYLGSNYGIYENNVDHNIWGNKYRFPSDNEIYFPIIINDAVMREYTITVERDNVKYSGKKELKETNG